jgi:hypothetical protein
MILNTVLKRWNHQMDQGNPSRDGDRSPVACGLLIGAAAIRILPIAALQLSISTRSELWFYSAICIMPIVALVAVLVIFRRAWVRVLMLFLCVAPLGTLMVGTFVNNLCALQGAVGRVLYSECL